MKIKTTMVLCALCMITGMICLPLVGFGLIYAGSVNDLAMAARLHEIFWGSAIIMLLGLIFAKMSD